MSYRDVRKESTRGQKITRERAPWRAVSRRRCGENSATNSATWRQTSSHLGSLISSQHPASWLFPFVLPAPYHSPGSESFEARAAPA